MGVDGEFRTALLVLVGCLFPVGMYFRIRSWATKERLSRREEGWLLVPLRLCGMCFFAATVAYLLDPEAVAWASLGLPYGVRWAGVVLGFCCVPLLFWVMKTLGKNLTDTVVTRAEHTLVTVGPYRWVRHPFYATGLLLFVALVLATSNGLLLVAGLSALALLLLRTPIEERKLVERFGDSYRDYMRRTGRFLPRWRIDSPRQASFGA